MSGVFSGSLTEVRVELGVESCLVGFCFSGRDLKYSEGMTGKTLKKLTSASNKKHKHILKRHK